MIAHTVFIVKRFREKAPRSAEKLLAEVQDHAKSACAFFISRRVYGILEKDSFFSNRFAVSFVCKVKGNERSVRECGMDEWIRQALRQAASECRMEPEKQAQILEALARELEKKKNG